MRSGLPAIALLLLGCATDPAPVATPRPAPTPRPAAPRALTPEHSPVGQVLPAGVGSIRELHFGKEFRYVGGQRFILRESADAEQHFFIVPAETGAVRRLYWIQFEQLLPGIGTKYDYSADAVLTVGGVPFRRNFRRWDTAPAAGSDRAAMYEFLAKHGYRIPEFALRIRLVHVPEANPREELMIVYIEGPLVGQPLPSEADIQRGSLEGLRVVATGR